MTDDAELERMMCGGLERRAGDADVAVPVAQRARASVRRRHRGRLAMGLAAASVVAVAAIAALDSTPPPPTPPEDRPVPAGPDITEWRTEYWADMQVDVPADWGYGGAPMLEAGDVISCFSEQMLAADGQRLRDGQAQVGYVGRPIWMTDVCEMYKHHALQPQTVPYVWLGADVEVGSVDLGDGFVQETVEVNGSTLTVGTDDPELRRRILDSARGGEMCLSEVEVQGSIEHDGALATDRQPTSMIVCAYRAEEPGEATLTYASRIGPAAAKEYLHQVERAGPSEDQCPNLDYEENEWVVLELTTDDGRATDRHVVHFVCPGIDVDADSLRGLETITLTSEMARPWAVGGIPAVIYGPTGGKGGMLDSFIGPQG
jgi:hypothetical protein